MGNLKAGKIKKGQYILYKNKPHYVVKTQFVSPGKGSAFTRTKLRDLNTGSVIEFTFKSHDTIEELTIESRELQFLYTDSDEVVFMDPYTYDQVEVASDLIGDKKGLLAPEIKVYVSFYEEKAIGVVFPPKVKLKVTEAQDAVAGDRQNAGKKPVTLETGMVVHVPLFIKQDEVINVDTETGEYVSRS